MARAFASASSQYLEVASDLGIDGTANLPISMACWFNVTNITAGHTLISLGVNGGTHRYVMFANGAFAGSDPVQASPIGTSAPTGAVSSASYTANVWQHGAVVFRTATDRSAYLNGGSRGDDTASEGTVSGLNTFNLGCRWNTTRGVFTDGNLAEPAVWNVALSDAEIASLAAGFSPLLVRPQGLIGYWPLYARATNEEPWVGASALAPSASAPTAAAHPNRIIYPYSPRIIIPAAAAAGVFANYAGGGFGSGVAAGGYYIGAD